MTLQSEIPWDSSYWGAQITSDPSKFAVFGLFARVEVHPVEGADPENPLIRMDPNVFIDDLAVAPTLPFVLITNTDWTLQKWSTADVRPVMSSLPVDAIFSNPSFNASAQWAVVMTKGRARVLRVDDTLEFNFSENEGLPTKQGQKAVFTGDDWVVALEDPVIPRLRTFGVEADDDGNAIGDHRRITTRETPASPASGSGAWRARSTPRSSPCAVATDRSRSGTPETGSTPPRSFATATPRPTTSPSLAMDGSWRSSKVPPCMCATSS